MTKEAMKLALEASKDECKQYAIEQVQEILEQAISEAAKQEQGEPVALNLSQFRLVAFQTDHPQDKKPMEWQEAFAQGWNGMIAALEKVGPLYTTPQQRKPLTDEQLKNHYQNNEWLDGVRFAEQFHGIKE